MTKQDFLKQKIEEMRKTIIKQSEEEIGKLAEKHVVSDWAGTPAKALLNTVLAIRQKWKETVEPRMIAFENNYPNVKTIYDLKSLMNSMSERDFCEKVFGMKIKISPNRRYQILSRMIDAFVQYQKQNAFVSDYDAMRDWARKCVVSKLDNDIIAKIPNANIATVQNLRICLGINTLKPDVHVKRALEEIGVGNEVGVCELISELTGYSPLYLDQVFWYWDKNRSEAT